ncbi:olfactory receptor 7C1-like [Vombatus ursinus]|uniref:G-protein coupled receptors family 1 profile domain-containing protein n=1 Tax=Vombatus ursinus TaxID=29139 RepID=A0A4X2MFK2_VOMUR|nr:olfactory receptor 7C1-like [Vombatus ursinus]
MVPGNQTQFTEFILLGFSEKSEQQGLLFGLFLGMYLVTVVGNQLRMLAIGSDSHLHTPMYFFLSNFSFVDICVVSTTVPKMLVSILTQNKVISYAGCLTQMYFFIVFGGLDNFLLTAMAYDHFVAICHALHYAAKMSSDVCSLLVLLSWIISLLDSLLYCLMVTRLSLCTDHEIQHFFFDLAEVLKLSCSDTLTNYALIYFAAGLLDFLPLVGILFSYTQICSSILKFPSAQCKYKAFSICGSHLSVVSLFYGTGFGVYLSSSATNSSWKSTVASAMYAVVTPMLNPFIYTLRNKDIKDALRRLISRIATSQ